MLPLSSAVNRYGLQSLPQLPVHPVPHRQNPRLLWALTALVLLCAAGLWLSRAGPERTPPQDASGALPSPSQATDPAPVTADTSPPAPARERIQREDPRPAPGVPAPARALDPPDQPPLLAAGIAMDPAGRPLAGLRWLVVVDDQHRATVGHRLEEDGAGRFALYGTTAAGKLLLWAQGKGEGMRTWRPVAVVRGAVAIAVELAPARSIEAVVLLPAGKAIETVDVAMPSLLRAVVPPTLSSGWLPIIEHQGLENGRGTVTVRQIPPGRHDLVFYVDEKERCSVEGVSVPAYLPVADLRLRAVDLR